MCSPLGAACAPHYRSHCRAGQRVCLPLRVPFWFILTVYYYDFI